MDSKDVFGWKSAYQAYTYKDLCKDSIIPGVLAILLTGSCIFSSKSSLDMILYTTSLVVNITPTLVSLLVAAYAILMTMYWSKIGHEIKKDKEKGVPLLRGLNASFVVAIRIMVIGFLFVLLVGYVTKLEIPNPYFNSDYINYPILFLIIYCMLFFVWIIKDIAINIYNIGQYSTYE